MGSDQSSLPAGAPGSHLRSQRDEEIPYTQYSISKPIDSRKFSELQLKLLFFFFKVRCKRDAFDLHYILSSISNGPP